MQTFQQGTKVFALRNGQPVMKWACGNPLSKFLPAVEVRRVAVPGKTITKVSPSVEEMLPADTQDILVPSVVESPVYQPAVPVHVGATSSALPIIGKGAAILAIAVPAIVSHGGGGSNKPPTHTPTVPETSSLAYLLVALPVLGILLAKKTRTAGPEA